MTNMPSNNRRRVGFANRTKVYLVRHINDYTEKEISSTWTNEEDTKKNQNDVVLTVKSMRCGNLNNGNNKDGQQLCSRGLEAMASVERHQERRANKASVIDAVLDEQDRQWDAGIPTTDWDKIAQESMKHSQWANDKALVLAASDAAAARRIQADDKDLAKLLLKYMYAAENDWSFELNDQQQHMRAASNPAAARHLQIEDKNNRVTQHSSMTSSLQEMLL